MPRYEQRDKDGAVTEVIIVTEDTLKVDPEAVIKLRTAGKSKAGPAPEGYEHVASQDGDPDALVSDVTVHYYAKKGSYEKEKPSRLSGLRAVAAEAEAKKEEQPTIK